MYKHIGPSAVTLQQLVVAALLIIDDAGQQVVGEVTLLQFVNLGKHQGLHLIETLSLLRCTQQEECPVIVQQLRATHGAHHLHGLVQIQVEETCTPVAQHIFHQIKGIGLKGISLFGAPSHPDLLSLLSYDRGILGLVQWRQRSKAGLLHVSTGFPATKILLDDGNGLVRVKVTCHTDGHVVRTIPLIEIVLDIRNRRVLQMLLRTDGGLCAIGMVRPEHLRDGVEQLALVLRQTDVILLVHSLQLGVEATDHHVLEPVTLDLGPVLDLVRGDILRITGHIVRGIGIRSLSTDGSHQLVILIGNEILGSHLAH